MQIYNQSCRHTSYLRSDNAQENKSHRTTTYCRQHGIVQQFTVPYNSNQNGIVERLNLMLFNGVRSMLASSLQDKKYWTEAVTAFVHTYNVSPHSANGDRTPHEIRFGHKPDVSHLLVFGTKIGALTSIHARKATKETKLTPRRQICTFMSYSKNSKAYRLLADGKIITARYEDHQDEVATKEEPLPTNGILQDEALQQVPIIEKDSRLGNYVWQSKEEEAPNAINAPPTHAKRYRPNVDYSSAFVVLDEEGDFFLEEDE